MTSIRDGLGIHANALALREQRNNILASNIANAATPGFKARDMDFQAELERVAGNGTMQATHSKHFGTATIGNGQMMYRDPVNPSLDGNTVELGVEQMEFAENALRYQTSLTLLNRKITGLMTAIKGE